MSRNFKEYFNFSRAEVRGVLWLLPLLAVVAVILIFANRPRFEKSFIQQVEETAAGVPDSDFRQRTEESYHDSASQHYPKRYTRKNADKNRPVLEPFDPNVLDAEGFERLGFSRKQAEVIVRYRTARGGFRIADDLAKCYVISDEMMERLRSYIRIAVAPTQKTPENALVRSKQSEHLPASVDSILVLQSKIELNAADSATLRNVRGIGNILVVRILDYRERLGGFVRAEQLTEIPGMYPENFERIITQISVDSCIIRKIDINFASPEALGKHPYITAEGLRKILKHRQLKGGWRTPEELINENILTRQQAERLAPYLVFN